MTKDEWNLLIEVALTVAEMASPDQQRRISRALEGVERAHFQQMLDAAQGTEAREGEDPSAGLHAEHDGPVANGDAP